MRTRSWWTSPDGVATAPAATRLLRIGSETRNVNSCSPAVSDAAALRTSTPGNSRASAAASSGSGSNAMWRPLGAQRSMSRRTSPVWAPMSTQLASSASTAATIAVEVLVVAVVAGGGAVEEPVHRGRLRLDARRVGRAAQALADDAHGGHAARS